MGEVSCRPSTIMDDHAAEDKEAYLFIDGERGLVIFHGSTPEKKVTRRVRLSDLNRQRRGGCCSMAVLKN